MTNTRLVSAFSYLQVNKYEGQLTSDIFFLNYDINNKKSLLGFMNIMVQVIS